MSIFDEQATKQDPEHLKDVAIELGQASIYLKGSHGYSVSILIQLLVQDED